LALLQHQLAAGEEHGGMVEGDDKVRRWRRRQRPRRRWRSRNYKVGNYKAYYYGEQTTTTRIATTTTTVSTAPPTGMWLLANAQDRCDDLCKFNGYGRCGAAEIAGINSTQAVAALMLQEFNITCNTDPNRNEDFGIFYASNDDCWFVDGTVDCSQGLSNVGRRPVCYCEGTTSTTTPDAGWAFGEDQDSCNDFCRFTGFDGCNASMIQEINTYPRAVRLIEGLGMNLTCDAAIRQKDTGVFINPSNIDPFFAQCFSVKGTVDCDVGFSSLKPLCFYSSTTVTTTLSVNWQLGSVGQTCNDLCTNGCNVSEMEQIFRMPRATRLIESMLARRCVQGGGSRSNGIFFDPTTGQDGKCFYFDPGAVNCSANDNPTKEAPVCYCNPAAAP